MSQQVWGVKLSQDLAPGDLIPGVPANRFALEINEIQEIDGKLQVKVYSDLYKRFYSTYSMHKDQHVPVARSGVNHMDFITNFEITK